MTSQDAGKGFFRSLSARYSRQLARRANCIHGESSLLRVRAQSSDAVVSAQAVGSGEQQVDGHGRQTAREQERGPPARAR